MKKNLLLRLCLILMVAITAYSCRTDQFPEKEAYDNSSAFQLTAKTISLEQSKDKEKLLPVISHAGSDLKKVTGPGFGDGITVDTGHVVYIENGPDYHTYTFRVIRENAPINAPLENLVLSPLTDGTYRKLLFTYHLTPQEKQTLIDGGDVDTKGKITITDLGSNFSLPSGGSINKYTNCQWVQVTTYTICSEGIHGGGKTQGCTAAVKSVKLTTSIFLCDPDAGEGNPGGPELENPTPPTGGGCSPNGVLTGPQAPNDGMGMIPCGGGIPTLPSILDPNLKNKCNKAKAAYENTAVKSRYEILKGKTSEPTETGYGFKTITAPDGTTSVQTNSLNPDATNPDGMTIGITPTTFGYAHTHLDKFDGKLAIKIHSPADINAFLSILRNAKANGIPLAEVFGGMIASDPDTDYNVYQLMYTGDGNDLPPEFSRNQIIKFTNDYKTAAKEINLETGEPLTHYEMQGIFFKTMKKMNIKNVVLSKREYKTGKYYIIEFDEYGNPTETPCP